jgi:hypothetical protein
MRMSEQGKRSTTMSEQVNDADSRPGGTSNPGSGPKQEVHAMVNEWPRMDRSHARAGFGSLAYPEHHLDLHAKRGGPAVRPAARRPVANCKAKPQNAGEPDMLGASRRTSRTKRTTAPHKPTQQELGEHPQHGASATKHSSASAAKTRRRNREGVEWTASKHWKDLLSRVHWE